MGSRVGPSLTPEGLFSFLFPSSDHTWAARDAGTQEGRLQAGRDASFPAEAKPKTEGRTEFLIVSSFLEWIIITLLFFHVVI